MRARHVYDGSNGAETRRLYDRLCACGAMGALASALFKAQKASRRAKRYGPFAGRAGRSFRDMSYDRKGDALREVCRLLLADGARLGIRFGWKEDPHAGENKFVLYVETPFGQVSFHAPERGDGPDYPGEWDGARASEERIIRFAQSVLDAARAPALV